MRFGGSLWGCGCDIRCVCLFGVLALYSFSRGGLWWVCCSYCAAAWRRRTGSVWGGSRQAPCPVVRLFVFGAAGLAARSAGLRFWFVAGPGVCTLGEFVGMSLRVGLGGLLAHGLFSRAEFGRLTLPMGCLAGDPFGKSL